MRKQRCASWDQIKHLPVDTSGKIVWWEGPRTAFERVSFRENLAFPGGTPLPTPSEGLAWHGFCKNGWQSLEPQGFRGQDLDNTGLAGFLLVAACTASALTIFCFVADGAQGLDVTRRARGLWISRTPSRRHLRSNRRCQVAETSRPVPSLVVRLNSPPRPSHSRPSWKARHRTTLMWR